MSLLPRILHVDIDAFFASVEQLRNPRLAGRPVAVGAGVIASCSYEARRFGLRAGMRLSRARELCPVLHVVDGHAAIYRCFAEHIFAICQEYTPSLETFLDEAYCDLGGTERLHPDVLRVGTEIRRRVHGRLGLSVTVGIGRNRMFARLATRQVKPDGLTRILPEDEDAVLRALPVEELPGVGPRATAVLDRLNVHTVSELRALPRSSLAGIFGRPGLLLHERAHGEDTRPVATREVPRSIRRETSFEGVTTDPGAIEGTLHYLTERAANTLRRQSLRAQRVEVRIRYPDFATVTAHRALPTPTRLDSELFAVAAALRRRLHQRRVGLRLVGVTLSGLVTDRGLHQLDLLEDGLAPGPRPVGASQPSRSLAERRREAALLERLDTIRARYGHASIVCGRSLHLLGKRRQDEHGFVLRTPSLTL